MEVTKRVMSVIYLKTCLSGLLFERKPNHTRAAAEMLESFRTVESKCYKVLPKPDAYTNNERVKREVCVWAVPLEAAREA